MKTCGTCRLLKDVGSHFDGDTRIGVCALPEPDGINLSRYTHWEACEKHQEAPQADVLEGLEWGINMEEHLIQLKDKKGSRFGWVVGRPKYSDYYACAHKDERIYMSFTKLSEAISWTEQQVADHLRGVTKLVEEQVECGSDHIASDGKKVSQCKGCDQGAVVPYEDGFLDKCLYHDEPRYVYLDKECDYPGKPRREANSQGSLSLESRLRDAGFRWWSDSDDNLGLFLIFKIPYCSETEKEFDVDTIVGHIYCLRDESVYHASSHVSWTINRKDFNTIPEATTWIEQQTLNHLIEIGVINSSGILNNQTIPDSAGNSEIPNYSKEEPGKANKIDPTLAYNLRTVRTEKGKTMGDLADYLGVSVATVSGAERGDYRLTWGQTFKAHRWLAEMEHVDSVCLNAGFEKFSVEPPNLKGLESATFIQLEPVAAPVDWVKEFGREPVCGDCAHCPCVSVIHHDHVFRKCACVDLRPIGELGDEGKVLETIAQKISLVLSDLYKGHYPRLPAVALLMGPITGDVKDRSLDFIKSRLALGRTKYGAIKLDDPKLEGYDWHRHALEEIADAVVYLACEELA